MAAKAKAAARKSDDSLGFTSANYIFFAIGIIVVILGFVALKIGSITIAPILLVIGYCVIIPIAILYRVKKDEPGKSGDS